MGVRLIPIYEWFSNSYKPKKDNTTKSLILVGWGWWMSNLSIQRNGVQSHIWARDGLRGGARGALRHHIWTHCQLVRLKEVEPDWKLHRSSFLMDSYIALHRFCIFDYQDLFGLFQSQKALSSRLVPIPVDLVWEYFWGQFRFFFFWTFGATFYSRFAVIHF